jgi:hypothetical protein
MWQYAAIRPALSATPVGHCWTSQQWHPREEGNRAHNNLLPFRAFVFS